MRLILLSLLLGLSTALCAQPALPVDIATLPQWMGTLVTGSKPAKSAKAVGKPLHTNAFIGTWTVEFEGGRRIEFWCDAHRMLLRELSGPFTLQSATLVDLDHNVKLRANWGGERVYAKVEDLYLPQASYFQELWNDSVSATGRTDTVLDHSCREMAGSSNRTDSTWYWTADVYPKLFNDMKVWAKWLKDGNLEMLSAFADRNAGSSLRVDWGNRRYGHGPGSMRFISIKPGKVPMPELPMAGAKLAEARLAWINNSGTGRLPTWMRAFLGGLPPDSLPLAYTPAPENRGIPDNAFIGTLTAETPTRYIDEHKDTTIRVAKYSYWADARRAVLQLEDPDDEGYIFYAVDLDADVVMVSRNEGHSFVIPKLEIASLESVGLAEFGRGLELDFQPQGQYRTILGRKCEWYTTSERFLHYFLIPTDSVVNPIFDIKNWMVQRISQKFKDLMFFGVADKPMPMSVMGTTLTSYKSGKAKPPVVDLSKYIVRDERLREKKRRERAYEVVEPRDISIEDMKGMDVAVPNEEMRDVTGDPEPHVTEAEKPRHSASGSGTGTGNGRGYGDISPLSPLMDEVMKHSTNHFIGTAKLEFTSVASGKTTTWTVRYASDADRMVMIGNEDAPLPSDHNRAYLIDRKAGLETLYRPKADGTPVPSTSPLLDAYASKFPLAYADSLIAGNRKFLGHLCVQRRYQTPTTSRTVWSDAKTASLFWDILGARKRWNAIEILMRGPMITSTTEGMPMEVNYEYHGGERMTMRVLEMKPGPVDPKVFEISKSNWRR